MLRKQLPVLYCLCLLLSTCNSPPTGEPLLVVISFDGFRYDYLDLHHAEYLKSLRDQGAAASTLLPAFPSKTFPNHYSLATGLLPGQHGIVSNHFYSSTHETFYTLKDREEVANANWYHGIPIWVWAEQNGIKSASMAYPGAVAAIKGIQPSLVIPYRPKTRPAEVVKQAIDWASDRNDRPGLILLYFADADNRGHRYGPAAMATRKAVQQLDRSIRQLVEGLGKSGREANFLFVSDHGMARVQDTVGVYWHKGLRLDTFPISFSDTFIMLYTRDSAVTERIWNQLKVNRAMDPRFDMYRRDSLPDFFPVEQLEVVGNILLIAHPYQTFTWEGKKPKNKGTHGYPVSQVTEMGGLFLGYGPDFRPGSRLDAVEVTEVNGLMKYLLKPKSGIPEKFQSIVSTEN